MNQPAKSGFAVDPRYRHIGKTVRPGPMLKIGPIELKWYDLASDDGVPPDMRSAGEAHLRAAAEEGSFGFGDSHEAGFVILHRCGADFYFLLTSVWRGSNELWESVRYRDGAMTDFAAFDSAYPLPAAIRPTFCLWELRVVDFEARAWSEFLRTRREEEDRERWRTARLSGNV